MLKQLWRDEDGVTVTTEVVLLTTVLVIGLVVGAKSLRDAALTEWADFAQAISDLDQSYNIPDSADGAGDGGSFVDQRDFCDTAADDDGPTPSTNTTANSGSPPSCVTFGVAAEDE